MADPTACNPKCSMGYDFWLKGEHYRMHQRKIPLLGKTNIAAGVSGYDAWEAMCRAFLEGFSLLVNNKAFGHPLPVEERFELALKVLIAGMKELEE